MPLTDQEKVKIRHHLGYLNVQQAATFVMGVPAAVQTQFQIESAMDKVLEVALILVRHCIQQCDAVEGQRADDRELLAVQQVDEITINGEEMKKLGEEYHYWRNALANAIGTYPNPYDKRFWQSSSMNLPVIH